METAQKLFQIDLFKNPFIFLFGKHCEIIIFRLNFNFFQH